MSTDLGFSLGRNLGVYMDYTPLNQDIISFMSAEGLTIIGIQRRDLISHFVMFLEFNPSAFAFPSSTSLSILSRSCN